MLGFFKWTLLFFLGGFDQLCQRLWALLPGAAG